MASETGVDLLIDFNVAEEPCKSPFVLDRAGILRNLDAAIESEKARQVELPEEVSSLHLLDLEDDTKFITEEEFDFDLPLVSTSTSSEDVEDGDEEVFFGPVGHTEKCVATILGEVPSEEPPVAPLTAAQIVELFTEAQKVAYHISAQNGDKRKDDQKLGAGIPIVISPLASPLPAEEKKHCRKGTFTLDSPFQDEAAPEPEPVPEPAPEFTRGASGRRSLPQRQLVGPSNLKLPLPNNTKQRSVIPSQRRSVSPGQRKMSMVNKNQRRTISPRKLVQSLKRRRSPEASDNKACKITGLRLPGPPASKRAPQTQSLKLGGLTRPLAQSGIQKPGVSTGTTSARPASGLKAPSVNMSTRNAPSQLRGPKTKLELLRTGDLQKRSLGTTRGKQPSGLAGPMKALGRPSGLKGPVEDQHRVPLKATVNGVPQQTPPTKTLASPVKRSSISTTPVKHEKNVKPKRLIPSVASSNQSPDRKSSESSSMSTASETPSSVRSLKCRSFLPTAGRTFTGPKRSSSSISSISSMDSCASPQLKGRDTPPVGRSRIQRTPVNKENESQVCKSIWSPLRRAKPINQDDERIQCTKRTIKDH